MKRTLDIFFYRSWWVFLFIVIGFVGFERISAKKKSEIYECRSSLFALNREKIDLKASHENLLLQLNSQKDPKWIEMVLMKKLGVVPNGKLKVKFIQK